MTEPNSADAEAPIEDIGDSPLPDENTDTSEGPVFEDDRLEDFNPHDNEGWPDQRPDGGNFEDVAFPPQPDEGVS
jgi:hypothetical protein